MRLNITARHFKLPEEIRDYAEKEVERLNKYYNGIIDTEVILSWEKFHRMAEITIAVYGTVLKSQVRSEEMHKAIKEAVDKLERQLVKYKGKMHAFNHEKVSDEQAVREMNQDIQNEEE
jgi:putative sigma-54 modulation protein